LLDDALDGDMGPARISFREPAAAMGATVVLAVLRADQLAAVVTPANRFSFAKLTGHRD
jgi:hypothetical protein